MSTKIWSKDSVLRVFLRIAETATRGVVTLDAIIMHTNMERKNAQKWAEKLILAGAAERVGHGAFIMTDKAASIAASVPNADPWSPPPMKPIPKPEPVKHPVVATEPIAQPAAPDSEPPDFEKRRNEIAAQFENEQREKYLSGLAKQAAHGDVLFRAIQSVAAQWPAVPPPPPPRFSPPETRDEEEIVLLISDVHIGEHVSAEDTGGLGGYDVKTFKDYLAEYQNALSSVFDIYRRVIPIRRITVAFMGDLIDGRFIYRGQTKNLDLLAMEQMLEAERHFGGFVRWLAGQYEEVVCVCVCGNHGRIGQKGEGHHTKDNLEWGIYNAMKWHLEDQPNVRWHIPSAWYALVDIMGHRFVFAHGEDIKGWNSIPFYGLDRASRRIDGHMPHEIFCVGHHHQPAMTGSWIMNGCWPGPSEFSLKALQTGTRPSQKFLMVHRDVGITVSRDIYLADRSKFSPVMFSTESGDTTRVSPKRA